MTREDHLDSTAPGPRPETTSIATRRPRGRPRKGTPTVPKSPTREPGYGRLQHLLREDILEGRIAAGSRLKVSEIAARYATSTNPAREALQGLEGEGLVTIS